MISTRFVSVVLFLLVLTAVPTTMHSYLGATSNDGFRTSVIAPTLLESPSQPVERRDDWVRRVYGSDDWIERLYQIPPDGAIQLFVSRSHDHKKLYHHPELGVAYAGAYTSSLRPDGVEMLPTFGGLPVHVLRGRERPGLAVFALRYKDQFVGNPYLFQVRSSFELLVQPRRAMTLFFAHDRSADPGLAVTDAAGEA